MTADNIDGVRAFHSYWVYYKEDENKKEMLVKDIFGLQEYLELKQKCKENNFQIYLIIEYGRFPRA